MNNAHKITNCNGCLNCLVKCPATAILIDENKSQIAIDRFKCVNCAICMETCPIKAIEFVEGKIDSERIASFDCAINRKRMNKFQRLISALKISLDSKDTPINI